MRKWLSTPTTLSYACAILLAVTPMMAQAATEAPLALALAPVLITEVQPGSPSSASEEFIELYNTTSQTIDLGAHGWRLEIASSAASSWTSPLRTIVLSGQLAAGQSYLVASQFTSSGQTTKYLANQAQIWFSAGITATSGHIRLVYETNQTQSDHSCSPTLTVVDQVEWSTFQDGQPLIPSIDGRPVFLAPSSSGLAKTTSLQRQLAPATNLYADSNNDSLDFQVGAPSPGLANSLIQPIVGMPSPGGAPGLPTDNCPTAVQPPEEPPIEPEPEPEPDPAPGPSPTTEPPAGELPEPVAPSETPVNAGLVAPIISELLPDPASPQTDAQDEFIELYNPNTSPFDLSGYKLQTGLGTTHAYAFPAGTNLAPGTYTAFFARDTKLSLSNSESQATLIDPSGLEVAHSDAYKSAKAGQAWALVDAKWQWTTQPTPGAINQLVAAPAKTAVKKAPASPKAPAKAPKSSPKTKSAKTKTTTPTQKLAAKAEAKPSLNPLRPWVLALAAGGALLYGAYEYRGDLANRIHKLRANRKLGRQARPGAKRGRSD